MLIFYVLFSYMYLLGANDQNANIQLSNIILAPLFFPLILGQQITILTKK